jgi:hypothetical protein
LFIGYALLLLQRSLQYFTSGQHRSHFFRQLKGRMQTGQILAGRVAFFRTFIAKWICFIYSPDLVTV